ncbi:hypothetical protein BH11ARM2_BH11ARM2_23020 [soil metagenome]
MSLLPLFLLGAIPTMATAIDFNAQLEGLSPERQAELQKEVKTAVDEIGAPGATAAIVIDGKLVAAVASGIRKVGSATALKVTDPMHIGSNTKGMTALAFARLEQEKVLRWTMTLAQAFPRMASMNEAYLRVPLFELAYQRSGFPDSDIEALMALDGLPVEEARARFAESILSTPPEVVPGTDYRYRNGNYVVLGVAIEAATSRSWEEIVRAEVFRPLGMKRAGFGPMGTGRDITVPWQHQRIEGKLQPVYADNPLFIGPAATVHCSVLDLANYAQAWVSGLQGDDSFLPRSAWKFLVTPPPRSEYACGVVVDGEEKDGVPDFWHNGSNTFSSSEWRVLEGGRLIVVGMLNAKSDRDSKLFHRLEDLGHKWLEATPRPAPAPLPDPSSEKLGENLLQGVRPVSLVDGNADANLAVKPEGIRFDVVRPEEDAWQASLAFLATGLQEGHRYLVSFDAKSAVARKVDVASEQQDRPHDNCGLEASFDCGTAWSSQRFTFTARSITGGQVRVTIFFLGKEKGTFWCRNVRVSEMLP